MRIDGNNNNTRRPGRSSPSGGASESNGASRGGQGGDAARMDLNLPHLRSKLESLPEVRENRVETLKDAIDRGEYEVGGREVVDRLLSNVLLENLK